MDTLPLQPSKIPEFILQEEEESYTLDPVERWRNSSMGAFSKYVETTIKMYCNHLDVIPQMQGHLGLRGKLTLVFDRLKLKLRDDPTLKAPWHHSSPACSLRSVLSTFSYGPTVNSYVTSMQRPYWGSAERWIIREEDARMLLTDAPTVWKQMCPPVGQVGRVDDIQDWLYFTFEIAINLTFVFTIWWM